MGETSKVSTGKEIYHVHKGQTCSPFGSVPLLVKDEVALVRNLFFLSTIHRAFPRPLGRIHQKWDRSGSPSGILPVRVVNCVLHCRLTDCKNASFPARAGGIPLVALGVKGIDLFWHCGPLHFGIDKEGTLLWTRKFSQRSRILLRWWE
jgi:hypothetical protein